MNDAQGVRKMMDDETRWQDAAIPADNFVGPVQPESTDADEPMDELETGIASIFAAMQAAEDGDTSDAATDDEPAFEEAHTFQLLTELDRLWQRPSP